MLSGTTTLFLPSVSLFAACRPSSASRIASLLLPNYFSFSFLLQFASLRCVVFHCERIDTEQLHLRLFHEGSQVNSIAWCRVLQKEGGPRQLQKQVPALDPRTSTALLTAVPSAMFIPPTNEQQLRSVNWRLQPDRHRKADESR
jgi:hypothetical protein